MPLSPKAGFGFPVFASSEYNFPSLEPKTICAGSFPVASPVLEPARGWIAGWELIRPEFLSADRINRRNAGIWRREIHHSANHERRDFARTEAGAELEPAASAARNRRFITDGSALAPALHYRGAATAGARETWRPHVINPRYLELATFSGVICFSGENRRAPGS